jgi:hypothetical protein
VKRTDDRLSDDYKTHRTLVTATDKFMSNWGGLVSKCAWACRDEHVDKVLRWVHNRPEMKYVNTHYDDWRPSADHVHIYVVKENHPALW